MPSALLGRVNKLEQNPEVVDGNGSYNEAEAIVLLVYLAFTAILFASNL